MGKWTPEEQVFLFFRYLERQYLFWSDKYIFRQKPIIQCIRFHILLLFCDFILTGHFSFSWQLTAYNLTDLPSAKRGISRKWKQTVNKRQEICHFSVSKTLKTQVRKCASSGAKQCFIQNEALLHQRRRTATETDYRVSLSK